MSLFGDLNEVKLLGNMTGDVELRYTGSGKAVANFSVATNRRYKQGDEWVDAAEYHNVVVWDSLAQQLAQRSHKGTRVLVQGRLQTRSWEGQDGKKNYKTEVVANDVFLIDRYEKGASDTLPEAQVSEGSPDGGFGGGGGESAGGGNSAPARNSSSSASKATSNKSSGDDVIDPDDLPF